MQADIAALRVQRRPPAPIANSSHGAIADVVSMSLAAGARISAGENPSPAERFMDWKLIGSGGVADVFRVVDKELGVPLAIKILKQIHREDRRYIDSLRSEVLISRKLRHPNICPIHAR